MTGRIVAYDGQDGNRAAVPVIVVLGCRTIGHDPTRTLRFRLETALVEFERARNAGITAYVLCCGGQGQDELEPESVVMARWLADRGIPEDLLLVEDASHSTEENLMNAQRILLDVTSGMHMADHDDRAHHAGTTAVSAPPRRQSATRPTKSGGTEPVGLVGAKPSASDGTWPTGSVSAESVSQVGTRPTGSGGTRPTGSGGTRPTGSGGDRPVDPGSAGRGVSPSLATAPPVGFTAQRKLPAVIVTSWPHVARAQFLARRAGFRPVMRGAHVSPGRVPHALFWEAGSWAFIAAAKLPAAHLVTRLSGWINVRLGRPAHTSVSYQSLYRHSHSGKEPR
ncbi:YdcF family protein [Actinobaculum sp. 352]|uniref:YdcF family protein n=1 Tax=Actinobaculum sp. 352 TaxID=2490946 RepID=UPI000F7F82D2|nr:YdcF family protein [Actinobaculum sp. 352]RTE49825.1 hypothetical protein EKN07_04685 [Actinobaculum sp. 352]